MRTHYIAPERDIRDFVAEAAVDVRSLTHYDVRLVIDSSSAERDAYALVEIQLFKDGRPILGTITRIAGTGPRKIGINDGNF